MTDDPTARPAAAPADSPRWSTGRVVLFLAPLFLLLAFPVGFWPDRLGSPHEYLALALYQRGETDLNQEVFDYDFNRDLVLRQRRFKSNKPPGAGLWLLPAVAAIDLLTPGPVELAPLCYFGRLLMLTLPFVLFLFLLGRSLERLAPPAVAWGLVIAFALGSNAGAYSAHYFSHMIAGMALTTSLLMIWRGPQRLRWLAGMACGFGVITEYQTAGIALVLVVLAAFDAEGRFRLRLLVSFGLAVPVALAAMLLYNLIAFGSVGEIGYVKEFQDFKLESATLLGFSAPSLHKLLMMLFSPAYGLFFFSPWLLLFFPAALHTWRAKMPDRRMLLGAAAAAVVLPGIISSHEYFVGGAVAGPRYLTAGLAFSLFPIAAFLGSVRGWLRRVALGWLIAGAALAIVFYGLIMVVISVVDTDPEHLMQNPLSSYIFPMIREGRAAFTVAHHFGASMAVSHAIFGLLFAATLGAFFWIALRTAGGRGRLLFGGCTAAGLLAFVAWPFIGSSESEFATNHLEWQLSRPPAAKLPRLDGSLCYMHRPQVVRPPKAGGSVHCFHPAMNEIATPTTRIEKIATNFRYAKGPVWMEKGYLLFSDLRKNAIFRYDPAGRLSIFRGLAGYWWDDVAWKHFPGPNGLAVDLKGRLIITETGNQRLSRIETNGRLVEVAYRYQGKLLNGPSASAVRSDGSIYFTDPPFGLRRPEDQELPFAGVYRVVKGKLELLSTALCGPQGLAFSPDERFLYVGNWDGRFRDLLRFRVRDDGSLTDLRMFFPMREKPVHSRMDGLAVDRRGNVYFCGHDGIRVLSPAGRPLGLIRPPNPPSSLAFGDADRRTLYITAYVNLYRMRVGIPGCR